MPLTLKAEEVSLWTPIPVERHHPTKFNILLRHPPPTSSSSIYKVEGANYHSWCRVLSVRNPHSFLSCVPWAHQKNHVLPSHTLHPLGVKHLKTGPPLHCTTPRGSLDPTPHNQWQGVWKPKGNRHCSRPHWRREEWSTLVMDLSTSRHHQGHLKWLQSEGWTKLLQNSYKTEGWSGYKVGLSRPGPHYFSPQDFPVVPKVVYEGALSREPSVAPQVPFLSKH